MSSVQRRLFEESAVGAVWVEDSDGGRALVTVERHPTVSMGRLLEALRGRDDVETVRQTTATHVEAIVRGDA